MAFLSDAVSLDRISRIVGYKITKGFFNLVSPNLPQRIAILAEANDANQSGLTFTAGINVTNAQQAGQLFGFGSPAYHIMRILRPLLSGDGVGAIPTYVYPQAVAPGATSKILTVTPVGVATENGTHYLNIAGREIIDGSSYAINIVSGDTASTISLKIQNAINAVVGSPVIANSAGYEAILTSKWSGLTANELSVTVDVGNNNLGLSYSVVNVQNGSGTPSIQAALNLFQNDWNTIVVNAYGLDNNTLNLLEAFNGIPSPDGIQQPTGRYQGIIMKPFVAISGSTLDDPSSLTDPRLNQVTVAVAPAPSSAGFSFEAAANMAYLFALQAQNNPNLDVAAQMYPDMPAPVSINTMAVYANRDAIVKKGCSTVNLTGGLYKVEDFVTTYHPVGENPPQYSYCRNLNIDWNVKYGYHLLELTYVEAHQIANDSDVVSAQNVVKPKMWKAVLYDYADSLVTNGLITNADFMKSSINVQLSSTNPNRFETFFRYKRSGFVRIAATTAQAGFNFGNP